MMRAGVVVVAAVLAAGVAVAPTASPAPVTGVLVAGERPTMAPCEYEDGPGPCVWDASGMGNGIGRSFLVTTAGEYVYVPHTVARWLLGTATR